MLNHLLAVTTLLGLVACLGAEEPKLEEYRSKEGKYLAKFPGKPKEVTLDADLLQNGVIATKVAELKVESGAYIIMHHDFKENITRKEALFLLKLSRDSAVKNGKVIDESEDSFGVQKSPMRIITCEKYNTFFHHEMIFVGDRMYEIIIMSKDKKTLDSEQIRKFIDSFALTK